MKKKTFSIAVLGAIVLGASMGVIGCGPKGPAITLWVGGESAKFYQKVANKFFKDNPDYGYRAVVKGVDTGTISGTITTDPNAAADIYTVAHDNIAKLVAAEAAAPITDESLINQVEADNPEGFKNVIYVTEGEDRNLYGVPYISQSLFLYYNKKFVSDEQAKTFEGLKQAAVAANTKAFAVVGDDGYNFSFTMLARKESDKSSTLRLYEGGDRHDNWVQGDDEVAFVRWANEMFADPNGGEWPPANWITEVQNEKVLGIIGGAWHFNSFAATCDDFGIAKIPTFTLTANHVAGLTGVAAGDVYRGGTFADCKVFMMNKHCADEKREAAQALMKYLSSKEIQQESFVQCNNVPAFAGVSEYIKENKDKFSEYQYALGVAQTEMAAYGIAQPFVKPLFNTYFYSKNAPQKYVNCIKTKTADLTLQAIREALFRIEYTWGWGEDVPEGKMPATLPASTVDQL